MTYFQDGKQINAGMNSSEFTNVNIPSDFISKIYVGRCPKSTGVACSSPESQVTFLIMNFSFLSQCTGFIVVF